MEAGFLQRLENVELFRALPRSALEQIAASASPHRYPAGTFLFKEGDLGESLHILTKGLVKIVRVGEDGAEVTFQTVQPGQIFGELAVLDPAPRSASAIAIDESETLEVTRLVMEHVLDRDPSHSRRMLGTLARSLTEAKEQVVFHNQILDEKVREKTEELRDTQLEIIHRLGLAAEFRDDDTGIHITRMSRMCAKLARAVGLSEEECDLILHASPMHDVGKIGIPDAILLKPGKLTDEEFETMKTHTVIGGEMLAGSPSAVMQMAEEIALGHHEKFNGRGYPKGLKGDEIPLSARICAICDVFDALISDRPYKKAWSIDDALALIEEEAGEHFDPNLVPRFLGLTEDIQRYLTTSALVS